MRRHHRATQLAAQAKEKPPAFTGAKVSTSYALALRSAPYRTSGGPPMLRLSDDQLDVVRHFAEPLHPSDRSAYLQRVSALLDGKVIGPGLLHRVCEAVQLELRRPTAIDGRPHSGKYAT